MTLISTSPSAIALATARDVANRAAHAAFSSGFDCLDKPERAQVLASLDPKHRQAIESAEAGNPQIDDAARQIAAGAPREPGGLELVDESAKAREAREAEERKALASQGPAATALRIATGAALPSEADAIARRIAFGGETT